MGPPGTPTVRPQGWWYLVPTVLAVVAIVACVTAIRDGWREAQDASLRANTAAPGVEQPLTIAEPAGYTVAYYGPILITRDEQRQGLIDDLELSIVPADGGSPLPLRPYDGLRDFTAQGQQYVPLLTVRFEEPGEYVLRSSPFTEIDRERAGVAVSESPFRKLRSGARQAAVILGIGLALALLVTVILARTRGRAKKAIAAPRPPPAPWPPQQAWAGQPPAWGPSPGPGPDPGPGAGPPHWPSG